MTILRTFMFLLGLLASGCGLPYLGEEDCESLGPSECDSRADCSFVFAAPLEGDTCLGEMEPVGCATAMSDCQATPTAEADGSGTCWLFRDGCRPEGWQSVDASVATCPLDKLESAPSCSTEAVDCTSLDGDACLAETACRPVFARSFDRFGACRTPSVAVACVPRESPRCDGQSTTMMHHGECWMFQGECVPDDWRPTYGDGLTGCGIDGIWESPICG